MLIHASNYGRHEAREIRRGLELFGMVDEPVSEQIERVGILPGVPASDVDGDPLLEEPGPRTVLQRPVVPRLAQRILGKQGLRAELQAAHRTHRGADAAVVPGADDKVVPGLGRLVAVPHMHAVVLERPALVAVVVPGDGEDGDVHRRELGGSGHRSLPVPVGRGVLQPRLKTRGAVAYDLVEFGEGAMVDVSLREGRCPHLHVPENGGLGRVAAGEGQPGHVVGNEDVVHEGEVRAQIGRGRRHDRGQGGRKLLRCRPLVPSTVRRPVHPHPAVRPRLRRQPLDNVVAVLVFVPEGFELSLRVPAPAHINGRKDVSPAGVVAGLAVVHIADVRGEAQDDRQRLFLIGRAIDGAVEVDAVPYRDLDAPFHLHVGALTRRGGRSKHEGHGERGDTHG